MKNGSEALETYTVTAARVIDSETFALVAHADDTHPAWQDSIMANKTLPVRLLSGNTQTGIWGWLSFFDQMNYRIGAGQNANGNKQALFVSNAGHVVSMEYQDGPNQSEGAVDIQTSFETVSFIDGHFYASGGKAFLARRTGPADWDTLSYIEEYDRDLPSFSMIKGFAQDDIYLAGNKQLWHWDGTHANALPLPDEVANRSDLPQFTPRSVTADDAGRVYIGGSYGEVIVGDKTTGFALLVPAVDHPKRALCGMAWFQGTLWAVTGTALVRLANAAWEQVEFVGDDIQPTSFNFLDAKDGVLLAAGHHSGSVYDGQKWAHLYG